MNTVTDNVTPGEWVEIGRTYGDYDLDIMIGIKNDWRPILTVHSRPNGDIQYSHDECEANAKAVISALGMPHKKQ